MDINSFIFYIKTENVSVDISKYFERRSGTSNCKLERPLSKENNRKVITLMKDKLRGERMTEFASLRPKTYSYLTDDNHESKKNKRHKKVSHKKKNDIWKLKL